MTTTAGVVKLLDLGLAKQSGSCVTGDETQTMGITQAGTAMDTPAYLSPEQAEGRPADARSGIFSFGALVMKCSPDAGLSGTARLPRSSV